MAYTFDGINKLIILSNGTTNLDCQNMYSRWVDWVATSDNSKYLMAFRTVGGDSIGEGQNISSYFFLMNGWRIRPYEGNHSLAVIGNLFVEEGGSPFVSTLGNYNVLITLTVSSDSKFATIATGSGVTEQDKTDIKNLIFSNIVESSLSFDQMLRIIFSVLAGVSSGGGTNLIKFNSIDQDKERIRATVDQTGNRLNIEIDGS